MVQPLPLVANGNLLAPNSGDNTQPGSPTLPPGSLSQVANTSIAKSNSNLTHVCDITGDMKLAIAKASLAVKELIESIRTALEGLWASSSSSPFADEVRLVIKAIKNKVKEIQKLIAKAQEVQSTIQEYIQKLQELIAFIVSLPNRIAKFLTDCLSHAQASLIDAIKNAKDITTAAANTNLAIAQSAETAANNTTAGSSSGPTMEKP